MMPKELFSEISIGGSSRALKTRCPTTPENNEPLPGYRLKHFLGRGSYGEAWEAVAPGSEAGGEAQGFSSIPDWAKNDHLGFEIVYVSNGIVRKYRPDYLIRLTNGTTLVLELKGDDTQQNKTKRKFLTEWVKAVNQHGGFGHWASDASFNPSEVPDILAKHSGA